MISEEKLEQICNNAHSNGFEVTANYVAKYATFTLGYIKIRFDDGNTVISTQETRNFQVSTAKVFNELYEKALELAEMLESENQ